MASDAIVFDNLIRTANQHGYVDHAQSTVTRARSFLPSLLLLMRESDTLAESRAGGRRSS
jgi:hypothetical protein